MSLIDWLGPDMIDALYEAKAHPRRTIAEALALFVLVAALIAGTVVAWAVLR